MTAYSAEAAVWRWETTSIRVLVDASGQILRHINVRQPYLGEAGGTKYVLTGAPHKGEVFDSMEDAVAAAQASL